MATQKLRGDLRQLRASLVGCEGFGAMSMADSAKVLKLAPRRLAELVASGALLVMRVHGVRMIPRSEVRRELARRRLRH